MIPDRYNDIFFDYQRLQSYKSAEIILPIIAELIKPNSVIDVGCGIGAWLKVFKGLNINTITGLDGDYLPFDKLLINNDEFIVTNLEKKIKINKRYDLAMCLEVAEHLSSNRAASFIADLCSLSNVILFSSAIIGQEGTMHINEQYPDYWIDKFKKNNFECFDCIRPIIWANSNIEFWYKQNIMIFINKEKVDNYAHLKRLSTFYGNSIVHPDLFNYKTNKSDSFLNILNNPLKVIRYYLSKTYHSIVK